MAIKDAGRVKDLKELIKDVPQQPEILVGDEGAVEVARHPEVDAVITGQPMVAYGTMCWAGSETVASRQYARHKQWCSAYKEVRHPPFLDRVYTNASREDCSQ